MVGFTNLDESESQTSVAFRTAALKESWSSRTKLEKILLVAMFVMALVVLGLIIGLAATAGKGNGKNEPPTTEVCLTEGCAKAAARLLESMDRSVNPCVDFYTYACGTWKKTHVIPDDRYSISALDALTDRIDLIVKELLEDPKNYNVKQTAWRKAKDLYASCMNTDLIEQLGVSVVLSLLHELGGWPLLGTNPGGSWSQSHFNLTQLLITLAKYNADSLLIVTVDVDIKNTTGRIIYLDQPTVVSNGVTEIPEEWIRALVGVFNADHSTVTEDINSMSMLVTDLNNITMKPVETIDEDLLYYKRTVEQIEHVVFESAGKLKFDWYSYISSVIDLDISKKDAIVLRALPYFQKLFGVLERHQPRVLANYMVWSFVQKLIELNTLPSSLKSPLTKYTQSLLGQSIAKPRWRECVTFVNKKAGMVISQKFVEKENDMSTIKGAKEMTKYIGKSFKTLLNDVNWIDEETKQLARRKADGIRDWIGYPDSIFNNDLIDKMYENIDVKKDEYFQNVQRILRHEARLKVGKLREPYDKTADDVVWKNPPTTVNAFYHRVLNAIIIPAGILQIPLYDENQPKSMNYGGIGTILGHELTHGFDSTGRKYNENGELKQWWEQKVIDRFNNTTQCIIDQYEKYVIPETNMTINGQFTLSENIADNGGLKQSYRAYRSWVEQQGKEERNLPGLNFTHDQLFFISFAQHWCINTNRQAAILLLPQDIHSPDQFRVIGSLQNSLDFARAFNCPKNSYMNPDKKCSVW